MKVKRTITPMLLIALVTGLFFFFLQGCNGERHHGAATPEILQQVVKESYEIGNAQKLFSFIYVEGSPQEVQDKMKELLSGFGSGKLTVKKISLVRFSDLVSDVELPGQINGRKLKWLVQPTHWIVLEAEPPNDSQRSSNDIPLSHVQMQYAVAEIKGSWWLVGSTFISQTN